MIGDLPAQIDDRAVLEHLEGDLSHGPGGWAIGKPVERCARFTILFLLPRMDARGKAWPVKNGHALAGHGADAVRDALSETIPGLLAQLRRSLSWDPCIEMAQHAQLRIDTGLDICFCAPRSRWQRGSIETFFKTIRAELICDGQGKRGRMKW